LPKPNKNPESSPSATNQAGLEGLLDALTEPASANCYDEVRDESGQLRPLWAHFFSSLGPQQIKHLADNANTIARVISQNGITYNVYDADQAQTRPWSLNPLPLLVGALEWKTIATGIAQRARVLNETLKDIYGPQTLLREGYLPAALVKGHPGYLRALHESQPPGGIYLHTVAFDIARGPDGQWWVISNRTQSPSGLGYVLENRLIISRMFPEAFRDMRIQHIASSYRRLLTTMNDLAQPMLAAGEPLRFALLTPGPYNETYFEHAYLARYLGLPLVEGADLMVREEKLYLKTLNGLQRIHGLLRRVDDEFMDPLELRADSGLGVPGLLTAIRAQNVLVSNALGTGCLESPAIQGFLPAIAEKLCGQSLLLPSLDTWWCGEASAYQDISPQLHTQVVKPTYMGSNLSGFQPIIAAELEPEQLEQLRRSMEARPEIYTAQTYLPFSQTMTWQENRMIPKAAMLRVYALANAQGEWEVLPGGMTRIASADPHMVSISRGGSTQDTWVETHEEVDTFSLLSNRSRVFAPAAAQPHQLVSSRTAENLFWLGRYTERAEFLTRLARESLVIATTSGEENLLELQDAVTELAIRNGLVPEEAPSLSKSPKVFARTLIAGLGSSKSQSVGFYLNAIDNNLRLVRDRLPSDHLKLTGTMRQSLARPKGSAASLEENSLLGPVESLDNLGLQLAALTGLQLDRMTRDLGWRMLTIGRLLERLVIMSETLHTFFGLDSNLSSRGFDMILSLFDSTITYRSRYQGYQDIHSLVELLVFDDTNPRALAWILNELLSEISHLPGATEDLAAFLVGLENFLPRAEHALNLTDYSQSLADYGRQVSDQICSRYFAHVETQRMAS
jgi:uncharacterized circularly permuted ATP-grasp superfamily protein/uncharacterized alpha-E superfamily protein